MDETDGRGLLRWAHELREGRSTWDTHFDEVRRFLQPAGQPFVGDGTPGEKRRAEMFDNAGETASMEFANHLHSMLTPEGRDWFGLRPESARVRESHAAMVWLEAATARMHDVFQSPASGFKDSLGANYLSAANYGNCGLHIRDRPARMPLYQPVAMQRTYVAENSEGVLDTVFSMDDLTARQALQFFGPQTPAKIAAKAEQPGDGETFQFWHLVFPRQSPAGGMAALRMPYASIWIAEAEAEVLRRGGYHERTPIVARWSKQANESYGRGQGMVALPDVKMLQRIKRAEIRGAERMIEPPLMVADDGVISPVDLRGNALISVEHEAMSTGRGDPIRPVAMGGKPELGAQLVAETRVVIREAFFLHLLRLPRENRMTLGHVLELVEEQMRVIGPFLGRLQNELLGPVIERTYGILLRNGAFFGPGMPELPQELLGEPLVIEYESPAARAQRVARATAVVRTHEAITVIAERHPSVMDNFDLDDNVRTVARESGMPATGLRDPRKVAKLRAARKKAELEQAGVEQLAEVAPAVQSLAQAQASLKNAGGAAANAA